jgi:hypothetical protein
MSDPDIGTLSVRFSIEERRLLEDFARISGTTVEGLIREALFLAPLGPRGREHLRVVHSGAPEPAQSTPEIQARPGWPASVLGAAPTSPAGTPASTRRRPASPAASRHD